MISNYEKQYMTILENIYTKGTEEKNERTGVVTRRIPHAVITVDVGKEFPILKSKEVIWKSAIEEILWIMQKQSNNIKDLRPHIWDSWADQNGSIGKAYGYQITKFNQVDYILDRLEKDPSDRRCLIDLWNFEDLNDMNLVPCCYTSTWNIIDGKLNCMLTQRSGDFPVGVPFNTLQYAALLMMFSKHLHVKPGRLTHCISDAHIYETQFKGVEKQIEQYNEIKKFILNAYFLDDYSKYMIAMHDPYMILNDKDNFYDFNINDFTINNYYSMPKIKYDVVK